MCICFYTLVHARNALVLATNRDEFLKRPTLKADFWQSNPEILAGVDATAGGTWFGINKRTGRFGLLTNVREELSVRSRSRGRLVSDWLESDPATSTIQSHLDTLKNSMMEYAGFNLLLGQINTCSDDISPSTSIELGFLSNRSGYVQLEGIDHSEQLHAHSAECVKNLQDDNGMAVLSNGALACEPPGTSSTNLNQSLEAAWPKMTTGRKAFQQCLQRHEGQVGVDTSTEAFVDDLFDSVLS